MQKVEAMSILLKSFRDLTIRVNLSIYITGSNLFLLFWGHFAIGSIISKFVFTTHNTFVMILVTWKGKLENAWKPL
jgi:hypothetical protein